MRKKNFGFTLSTDAADYLNWLREERSTNLSKFVERLILNAASDDDGYNPEEDVDTDHWGADEAMEILGVEDDGKSHD